MPAVYNQRRDEVPAGAVDIGRPGKWGNRYVVDVHGPRRQCIALYEFDLEYSERHYEVIDELRGRDLVCSCAPKPCHGDTLLRLANGPRPAFVWAHRHADGYECSSAGDQRYSPLYARMPDGRTIEAHYQCDVKGWNPGGDDWRKYKGEPPRTPMHVLALWERYLRLWLVWAQTNPGKIEALRAAATDGVLTDQFCQGNPLNQAHALAYILNRTQ